MSTKTRTTSLIGSPGSLASTSASLGKLLDTFNESYNHLYLTSNWQDLRRFIAETLTSFEGITLLDYSTSAEQFLIDNFNTLSGLNSSRNPGFEFDLALANRDLLYSNVLLDLILTSKVKIYDNDTDTGVPDLDLMATVSHIYKTLYLSLVDVCIKLFEFDSAVEKLMEFGIVQHYLQKEIWSSIHDHRAEWEQKLEVNYNDLLRRLYRKGIWPSAPEGSDDASVINQVIRQWKSETDIELWSRLLKIYLNVDSIYNALIEVQSLLLQTRLKILSKVKFEFAEEREEPIAMSTSTKSPEAEASWAREEYEKVERGPPPSPNEVFVNFRDNSYLRALSRTLSRTRIIAHIFTSSFNLQCFFIEGMLFLAHLCRDLSEDLFSLVYSILFDVLQVFISINCYYRYYHKKEATNRLLYAWLGLFKLYFKHFNIIPPVLQLVYNHRTLERRLKGAFCDSIMGKFMRNSSLIRRFQNPVLGFYKVASLLKSDLEHNFLFHALNALSFRPAYYESFTVLPRTPLNRFEEPLRFNLDYSYFKHSSLTLRLVARETHLGNVLINGTEISSFDNSQYSHSHFHFFHTLFAGGYRVRFKGAPRARRLRQCYDLSFKLWSEPSWVIRKFPDSILSVIIASCFLLDDIYIFIHYSQSLEYLQYKDTLKTKNRAIVQTLLPFVPKRSSKEAKRIISFQKHIKKKFKASLMTSRNFIPFVPNMRKTSSSVPRMLAKSHHDRNCEIYLQNQGEDLKISFKISSVRRGHRGPGRKLKVCSLKNPLLSSTKASYGHRYEGHGFRNTRGNRRSISKYTSTMNAFINSYATGENTDNTRFFGDASKCIHLSLGSSFKECDFCNKLDSYKHVAHLLYLIDLLSHYLFTLNVQCTMDYTLYFANRAMPIARSAFDLLGTMQNLTLNTRTVMATFADIMLQIDKSFYQKSCTYHNRTDYPYKILNEMMENTTLLLLSTVFHESYYNHLLSRLALYHLIKGRFNITLALFKQTLARTNMYSIDYGATGSHLKENYICDLDREFKLHLSSKIYIELLNDFYSFRKLNGLSDGSSLEGQDRNAPSHPEGRHSLYRLTLMDGVAHLRESASKFMASLSIPDTAFHELSCNLVGSRNKVVLFPAVHRYCPEGSEDPDDYRRSMRVSTDTLLRAIELDPVDYRGWYYLAQCSLFSNDLHYASRCCERSIECFDSCLASWLTKFVCSSTRIRTCAPFYTDDETWRLYHTDSTVDDSIAFKSLPSPLEPLFPVHITTVDELKAHLKRFVGDVLEPTILALRGLEGYGSLYVGGAILQLVARSHKNFNPLFPWEMAYLQDQYVSCKSEYSHNYDTSLPGTPRSDRFSNEFISNVKRMVSSSVESNYLLCAVPIMNLTLQTFLKRQFSLECRHHSSTMYSYNSSGLSLAFLDEELYGWVTCIEALAQIGESEVARLLMPILDLYLDFYPIDKYRKRTDKSMCKLTHANRNGRKLVTQYFSQEPVLGTNMIPEARYLSLYTKCYNSTGGTEALRVLLAEARALNSKYSYRKLTLLQNRLLTGLKLYSQAVQLGNQLHRNNMKIQQTTDFSLEQTSLLAFAHSLKMVGERAMSQRVDAFEKQMYLTMPVLRLDLCLNVPL